MFPIFAFLRHAKIGISLEIPDDRRETGLRPEGGEMAGERPAKRLSELEVQLPLDGSSRKPQSR